MDHVIESLVQSNSTVFESAKFFRKKLLPGLSSHLKGKAAGVMGIIELGFVTKSIARTTELLSKLNARFLEEIVKQTKFKQCKLALKSIGKDQQGQTVGQTQTDELKPIKIILAEHAARKYGEAVAQHQCSNKILVE